MIGHELTAVYGLDHAQTLAIVLPGVWGYKKEAKKEKVVQFGRRVLGVTEPRDDAAFDETVSRLEAFWNSIGMKTRLSEYGITDPDLQEIGARSGSVGGGCGGRVG